MKNLETKTLKAGSPLLMMCVKETATFDILTVAATCPIVCATATLKNKKKREHRSKHTLSLSDNKQNYKSIKQQHHEKT
jgi:3-keto-L-gulonate-6-phosphate decarboxylase